MLPTTGQELFSAHVCKDTTGVSLSSKNYQTRLDRRGCGYSTYHDYLINACSEDPSEEGGWYLYLRDLETGRFWTASSGPVDGQPAGDLSIQGAVATIQRSCEEISSRTDVCLTLDGHHELRRLQLTNLSTRKRHLDITSYLEVVLNTQRAHCGHPAFSKLFVQTEWHPELGALIAKRRPRGNSEVHPCVALGLLDARVSAWETDRARFIGRGRDCSHPMALTTHDALSGTVGSVLDPALALRTTLTLLPGQKTQMCFILAATDTHGELLQQAATWQSLDASRMFSQAELRVNLTSAKTTVAKDTVLRPMASNASSVPAQSAPRQEPQALKSGPSATEPDQPLQFFNGFGGFSQEGSEYVIRIPHEEAGLRLPPMPWTNVLANEQCGLIVSETGAGAMWSGNSREHRLTPWRNDPIRDPHDDAWYVRDNDSGVFWSPLPGPSPAQADYEVRHGFGYSNWQVKAHGLEHDVCMFIPKDDPLRIVRLRLKNTGTQVRHLSLYGFNRWVLGSEPSDTQEHVTAYFDAHHQALCAIHPSATEYATRVAFSALDKGSPSSWTCDRRQFIGYPGNMAAPQAVRTGDGLGQTVGSDPCAALQLTFALAPGDTQEVSFFLGEVLRAEELGPLLARYRSPGAVEVALLRVQNFWRGTVGKMQIQTPEPEIDLMVNGWLPYQNLACRMWGRTAFYQSGGAYGFRDQLQDAASLIYLRPDLTRRQILTNAAHQFVEGDVLHWWHPPLSKGMRTRFADDLLWLPYLTAYYINTTGDQLVLNEPARFLTAEFLDPDEDERYLQPQDSGESADVYEHCCRAIDRSLVKGVHGIPLFGCGDWNDGMSRVGREGKGESVWMGFFLYTVLADFLPWCELRQDAQRAQRYRDFRSELGISLNDAGWDGDWYRRAWYDNGAPLGSKASDECKIDALAQAWAVMSGVAAPERANLALDSLEHHLISDDDQLIRLLTPAFENTPNDPGYIKGYVAGVRENGGQYTHAALWVVKAMAMAGRRERATQLLKMLSPISHSRSRVDAERYKVEPYVIAADIYGVAPHVGRGGWTWYTGSAGWMYRVAVESILGFSLQGGNTLHLSPCIPDHWKGFTLHYALDDGTQYCIEVSNPLGLAQRVQSVTLDGSSVAPYENGVNLPLLRDGAKHRVCVVLGARTSL